jgi:hypothetical protein
MTIGIAETGKVVDSTSTQTAHKIYDFFAPLVSNNGRSSKSLPTLITTLCQDAYSLRMMMRKAKEGYCCEMIVPGLGEKMLLPKNLEKAEGMEVEGCKEGDDDQASDVIAYTLFGALLKYQQGKPMKVLEKAQVVLKRKK